jgi:hypothetical protein
LGAIPLRQECSHEVYDLLGRLSFFGEFAGLADSAAFQAHLAPRHRAEWVVYAKPPFGGPAAVLAYRARYTRRVAISNSRLVAMDDHAVRFPGRTTAPPIPPPAR